VQGGRMANMEAGPTLYPFRDLSWGERAREAPKSFALPTCQDPHFSAPHYSVLASSVAFITWDPYRKKLEVELLQLGQVEL
jgi:hypothetical protein